VTIMDDDHHELLSDPAKAKTFSTVTIKDHVWIGCNVTILKGTQIGNNCVVAAGSIVKGSFPDNVLLAGNPAKIIKQNINWK
jgi:acetyltransferase-like isoleucine patch superfamily enzyme